jgi:hypothetical protein
MLPHECTRQNNHRVYGVEFTFFVYFWSFVESYPGPAVLAGRRFRQIKEGPIKPLAYLDVVLI